MLKRFLGGFKKVLKGQRGYTLVEVAAVVAVTAILAAVVVPVAMDKMQEGKKAAALQDCKQIGNAIAAFYKDTGVWPAYSVATPKYFYILRSGDDVGHDPSSIWSGAIDYLENHLVVDNPGGTFGGQDNWYLTWLKLNWKGPYSETLTKRDPWGNNYLVYVKAMYDDTATGSTKKYGWIISAGPNATLETQVTANRLGGDDIGYYPFAAEKGH